jgi:transcription initiation factor TFIID subunit 7
MVLKIKLKPTGDKPPTPSTEQPPTPASGGSLKLKLKTGSSSGPSHSSPPPPPPAPDASSEQPKQKRKYTKKKDKAAEDVERATPAKPGRKRKAKDLDEDGEESTSAKKSKPAPKGPKVAIKLSSLSASNSAAADAAPPAPVQRLPRISIPNVKLNFKQRTSSTPNIKIKAKGAPPKREPGVGYDSEGEDIEIDPAIESQFILRMQPGEDCEYLRKMISEKKIGLPIRDGGADVYMRFFDKEGRRGMVTIRGRHYAASMLDLPCIVEGMKSWDKRGWYKSADICQIFLVHARVKDEEEAKKVPLPREVDQENWLYPHGLTAPMHWVRKRRFRKRTNVRTIEAVEEEVERLLRMDAEAEESWTQIIDLDAVQREESEAAEEQEGEYGDVIPGYEGGEDEEQDGEGEIDEMAALMQQEFERGGDEVVVETDDPARAAALINASGVIHASPDSLLPPGITPDSGPSPSATGTATEDEGPDGLFSGDEEDEEPVDEEELARQQELAQQREEIEDLRKEIAAAEQQMARQPNQLLKMRAGTKVKSLKADLQLKLASLGEEAE